MPVYVDCEQGSPEWRAARLGLPTASCFDQIITPTGKPSKSANAYLAKLLAERMTGEPQDTYVSREMQRGLDLEPDARAAYEFETDSTIKPGGIVYLDEKRLVAASPDGLLGDVGGLEIKCPNPSTLVGWILDGQVPSEYRPQVQGNLWVTGRAWWEFYGYGARTFRLRVVRDEAYIEQLAGAVLAFSLGLEAEAKRLGFTR